MANRGKLWQHTSFLASDNFYSIRVQCPGACSDTGFPSRRGQRVEQYPHSLLRRNLFLWLCSKAARPGSEAFRAVTAMEDRLLAVQAALRGERPVEQATDGLPVLPAGMAAEIWARPPREPHTTRELAALEESRPAYAARQSLAGRLEPIAERVRILFSRGGR